MSKQQAFPGKFRMPGQAEESFHSGMDLRDWFAGQALTGLMANTDTGTNMDREAYMMLKVKTCFSIADAMMKAREAHS